VARQLFDAIKADKPIGLDANALQGANGGSELDPNAPTPTTPATPAPTETSIPEPTVDAVVIPGLKGQSAAQYTCSVANN
jgi:hypothetical protein